MLPNERTCQRMSVPTHECETCLLPVVTTTIIKGGHWMHKDSIEEFPFLLLGNVFVIGREGSNSFLELDPPRSRHHVTLLPLPFSSTRRVHVLQPKS
ncbi:hypothetical protein CEXT_394581 [Caerostris extrusa]|uniref:Uncharacterized protein n=1 Tax=Caerostris extrusa TaxID=172846 RepID=A0AAV4VJZ5_CAEEX|nr:hypothetical protein CEXT_394581 [Caerostris extrusa]